MIVCNAKMVWDVLGTGLCCLSPLTKFQIGPALRSRAFHIKIHLGLLSKGINTQNFIFILMKKKNSGFNDLIFKTIFNYFIHQKYSGRQSWTTPYIVNELSQHNPWQSISDYQLLDTTSVQPSGMLQFLSGCKSLFAEMINRFVSLSRDGCSMSVPPSPSSCPPSLLSNSLCD